MNTAGFTVITNQLTEFSELLLQAEQQLEIDVDDNQHRQLLLYLDKLLFWNKAYNLTAIKQPKEALIKHVFDCLAIIPHLRDGTLLDIGTGAGLPGVIVAICQPDRLVTVLDSNQKKIRFIRQIVSELSLVNLRPIASRIENYNHDDNEKFDVVTSRAFASLTDFVSAAEPCLAVEGYLQAMKGLLPEQEDVAGLIDEWTIDNTPLRVPKLNDTRHLTVLKRKHG